jgi:8-hydroxy-5-deazaflavin:NADPH oxidoreductase
MTFVLTEPSTSRFTGPSERAPITISSAPNCFAAFKISSAEGGLPVAALGNRRQSHDELACLGGRARLESDYDEDPPQATYAISRRLPGIPVKPRAAVRSTRGGSEMKITIIGAGNMGRGIGTRAIAGGHEVEIRDRDPTEARALAAQLGASASVLEPSAPFGGEIAVFAVYYPGIKEAVQQYADRLADRVVVDITNPVDTETWDRLATPAGSSSAEEVAQLVPQGTPVVKAFNTTFAPTLLAGEVDGQQLDVLIAGDDGGAKQKVSQLVSDGGLRPIDVGPLNRAQQLEQLGFLHISIQQPLGLGFESAIKVHP